MSESYTGEISMFGFNFAPRNWAFCNGQIMAIAQNQALYALLGTIYGGDGRTTFSLPGLQGRSPMQFGTGPGLSSHPIGMKAGAEFNTLDTLHMPSHNHTAQLQATAATTMSASLDKANATVPTNNAILSEAVTGFNPTSIYDTNGVASSTVNLGGLTTAVSGSVTIGNNGSNQPVNNMSPYLAINFSISLMGIFPSRN